MPGMAGTMREFKNRTLRSGSKTGPMVTDPKQAKAIGMHEGRKQRRDPRRSMRRK